MQLIILIPAYGRKYVTQEAALADWNDNKDFKIDGGPMCSIRDFTQLRAQGPVSIRWKPHLYVSL